MDLRDADNVKLIYKGTDILKRVSVNQCVIEKYAELESDTLILRFNDVRGSWSQWSPEFGDEIKLIEGMRLPVSCMCHKFRQRTDCTPYV